jgi:hypothetical protein
MTKHTQGQWIVAPSSNKGNGSAWRDIHSTGGPFSPSYVGEALEQDAQLIAAAPDLLEALQQLVDSDPVDAVRNPELAFRKAREAIAKATNANPSR